MKEEKKKGERIKENKKGKIKRKRKTQRRYE